MKVLFLTQTNQIGASARYRVYQFLDYLESNGIDCMVSPAITDSLFKKYHESKSILTKTHFYISLILKRLSEVIKTKNFDIVFLQRDIIIHLYPILEKLIAFENKNIIFDFDDAIFLYPPNKNPSFFLNFLWDRRKIERIIRLSKHVIVSNNFLEDYAKNFTKNITVIPTSIDLSYYKTNEMVRYVSGNRIKIGWIGSQGTFGYLERILPAFQELAKCYRIELEVVGARHKQVEGLDMHYKDWNLHTEVDDIRNFNIGVMPLTNDEWSRGKSATKLLQYMAAGVPTVVSPVGVNTEIIKDGINGFLAGTKEDWIKKISILIENPQLHAEMAKNARNIVEKFYSVKANAPKMLDVIKKVASNNKP